MAPYLRLFLMALFASFATKHSISASVFLSIDCGNSESYKDENSIEWTGDDAYIQNGESRVIQYTSLVSYPMSTLRVFSTRKKNCYSIKVGEGERVLVRASFYYGNYDGKSSPPVFDLQFDGNYWTTVNTSKSYDVVSHEAIYVVKGNSTSICVAQTQPGQLPFISALEIRSLDSNMYSNVGPNYALRVIERAAFGSNETTTRYPVDAYDRIWHGAYGFGLSEVTSEAVSIEVTAQDNPPSAVLKNAVTSSSTLGGIELFTSLPGKPTPIYLATYFSEVAQLNLTQKRSLQVYIDSKPVSDSIVPPFGGVVEAYVANKIASASNSFSVRASTDSTLPPLINAMEIYTLSDELSNGTNAKDVRGLALLQSGFDLLEGWSGDPRLPSPYTWDWVECTSDAMPRITALNLSGYGLSGSLPDFSSMDALQTIDLSNNSLDGFIPDFLGDLPNLTLLNLANNRFSGTIPSSLSNNKKLKLVETGNCFSSTICKATDTPSPPKKDPTTATSGQTERPPSPLGNANAPSDQFPNAFPTSGDYRTSNKVAMILGIIIQLSLSLFLV